MRHVARALDSRCDRKVDNKRRAATNNGRRHQVSSRVGGNGCEGSEFDRKRLLPPRHWLPILLAPSQVLNVCRSPLLVTVSLTSSRNAPLLYLSSFQLIHFILFHSIPFYSIPFYSIPFYSLLFGSIPFDAFPYGSIAFHALLFDSMMFDSIPFVSMPFDSLRYGSILFDDFLRRCHQ